MSIMAITVMVHFIGLVNFHDRHAGSGREVILPLATPTQKYNSKDLVAHSAKVVIMGLQSTDCPRSWSWGTDSSCYIYVSKMVLQLPPATDSFSTDPSFNSVPHLQTTLCSSLDDSSIDLTDATKYSARLTLTNGTLSACHYGDEWISSLALNDVSPLSSFVAGTNAIHLSGNVDVYIINAPDQPDPAPSDDDKHFWWYYAIYHNTDVTRPCTALPMKPAPPPPRSSDSTACTFPIPAGTYLGAPAATGTGCSNSTYP